jgi:hypothetical protein
MFWFRKPYDIQALAKITDADAMRADLSGRRLEVRGTYEPWRIPMDDAAAAGNGTLARVLLECGSPLWGSSIYEAISVDAVAVLEVLNEFDPTFYAQFNRDKQYQSNPRLNRWTDHFTALDFARSIQASQCMNYLERLGAPAKSNFRKCRGTCIGIYISDDDFLSICGVNRDGLAMNTSGYYCAKCSSFQNW